MAVAQPPAGTVEQDSQTRGTSPGLLLRRLDFVERNSRWFLGGLLLTDLMLLLYLGRGLTFFYDEWDVVQKDYGGGWHTLVAPHVGNLIFFPIALYKVLFHLVGLDHYAVFRLTVIALHLISGTLIYVLAARRTSRVNALLAASLILFLGAAWEDLLWAFQVGYLLAIATGLAAWVLIERDDRLGDVGSMICLVISVGSGSLGLAVAIGIAVEMAWQRRWWRLWVVVVPVFLYALWYLRYGESQVTHESLIHAPGYVIELAAAAFGALIGQGLGWGRPLALAGALLLIVRLARPLPVTPRLAGMIAAALSLWVLTAVARSIISPPETSRYLYLGAVTIVLIGVEVLHGFPVGARATLVAAAVVAYGAVSGLTPLHSGSGELRGISRIVGAELGAVEIAAAHAPPTYRPDPERAPTLEAGPYLHTVRAIGSSPADGVAQILAAEPAVREAADRVLVAIYAPTPVPIKGFGSESSLSPAPSVVAASGAVTSQRKMCETVTPSGNGIAASIFALPEGPVEFRDDGSSPVTLSVRRFGEGFVPLSQTAAPHQTDRITIPADAGGKPWQLQLQGASPVTVCGVSP